MRIVQDMYDVSTTAMRCTVGVRERFEVKVGLHQGSALSPCLFAMLMDRMTDEIREEALWTMMFADDIAIMCGHARRKDDGHIWRRMLRMALPGKRKCGRPKRRFMDVVKEDMAEVELT